MFQGCGTGHSGAASLDRSTRLAALFALCAVLCSAPALAVTPGSVTYTYDEAGRLKSATYNNSAGETYTLDAAGNRKTTVQVGPDVTAPGAPGTPAFSAITAATATATWTAATDNVGVVGYDYRLNSGSWASLGNVLSANLSGLTPSTLYSFALRARDGAGNTGASSSASFTTTADTTAPSAPGVPTFSNITPTTATVSWTAATDNVGVTSYEYQKNGGAWTSVGNVLTTNLTGLTASTNYTIGVHAKDAAGNTGAASSGTFTTSAAAQGTFTFVSGSHSNYGGGNSDIATATIKNTGTASITGISGGCTTGSWHPYGTWPTTLAAGASGTFQCQPAASGGPAQPLLTLTGTGASNSPFSVSW